MQEAQTMTPLVLDLVYQMVIYAAIASILVDGAKRAIKITIGMKQEEKLNRFIPLALTLLSGVVAGFLLKSPVITATWQVPLYGVAIFLTVLVIYSSVLKGLLTVIPALFNKFAS